MRFGNREVEASIRRLYDIREVVYDKGWLKNAENVELYYMYRDLSLSKKDREIILESGLRYDITVIPPRMLGLEYVKTLGHYHPLIPGTGLSYTEIYEVLEGEAHYLLQKEEKGRIVDVAMVKAEKGDKVIIPPNYGHVTINPSNKVLKMANFVAREFSSVYEPYKGKGGAAYFELGGNKLVENENYGPLPEVRFLKPTNYSEVGLRKGKEMYGLIRKDPSLLRYLTAPQEFSSLFQKILE
jgi:glucose-6-phosphate isomerase